YLQGDLIKFYFTVDIKYLLEASFPEMKGFSPRNLKCMRKFAQNYPDIQFVQEVLAQITWYHNIALMDKIKSIKERL
ncbi:MAG: DUF1016 N-terminal domain-containing protein, partial [Candidatus Eremiobacteraeota bacterium]|nr:DUF1016 N-terminal domain-containing protein [Candidatus Eremiobacteraeota bacterium]